MSDDKPYGWLDATKDALTGNLKLANRTVIAIRQQHCKPCEMRNTTTNTCTICGCVLSLKVRLRDASCPMELW